MTTKTDNIVRTEVDMNDLKEADDCTQRINFLRLGIQFMSPRRAREFLKM